MKRFLRSLIGLLIMLALYLLLREISPEENDRLWYPVWRFAGFFVLSFCTIYLIPRLYSRIKLLR